MTLGTFDLDGKQISVETAEYSHIDGITYRLIESDRQIAVTTYRGLRVDEGVPFSTEDLQAGLRAVLRRSTR
jgi:hypothetical protein